MERRELRGIGSLIMMINVRNSAIILWKAFVLLAATRSIIEVLAAPCAEHVVAN